MDRLLEQFDPTGFVAWTAAVNGIPYPFYTVEGTVRFAGGQLIDIYWQCMSHEPPSRDIVEELRRRVHGLAGGSVVQDSLTVVRHYDLTDWR